MKNIILFNHGGSKNHGCEAIIRSLCLTLDKLKLHKYSIMSDNLDSDILYGIDQIAPLYSSKNKISKISWDFIFSFFMLKIKKRYEYLDILPFKKSINERVNKDTIAFSVGGDDYCYDDSLVHTMIHKLYLKKKCKTILWACSISPEVLNKKETASGLQKFDIIAVRESLSFNALKQHGFTNIIQFPDLAFLLPKQKSVDSQLIESTDCIGINISPLILKYNNNKLIINNYKSIIQYIINNTSFNVALIPHVVWDNNDDRDAQNNLYQEFCHSKRIINIGDHNCMELKDIISKCRFMICARTHASIAAYSTCVPTLVLGYSVKARGIAIDLFGTEENYVVPVQDLKSETDMLERFKWLMNNEDKIRKHLQDIMPGYVAKLSIAEDVIKSICND